jgi:hypothetical protein
MTEEHTVSEEPPRLSYGPTLENQDGVYVLGVTTDADERVDVVFGRQAMYRLWTEVKDRPWPDPSHHDAERDRLVRQVVHLANGADEEMLREAIAVLGGE